MLKRSLHIASLAMLLIPLGCSSDTADPASPALAQGVLRGAVHSTDGRAVEGARVRVSPHYGDAFGVNPPSGALTDAQGRYEIRIESSDRGRTVVRSDVAVEQPLEIEYFRDTLLSDLRLQIGEDPPVNVLDVVVDGRPSAVD